MAQITPFLWFDTQAEEAMNYYLSIFKDGRVLEVMRADGRVLTTRFEVAGQQIIALNGGPTFKFTEAFSLFVSVDTQEEVDELWAKLSAGGAESQCGWLKDKYGLSWQVVPKALMTYLSDPNPAKAGAAMQAMLKMNKIIIADLKKAHDSVQ